MLFSQFLKLKLKSEFKLNEMFESDDGYKTVQSESNNTITFHIETNEARDYKCVFVKNGNDYTCELMYDNNDEIKDDFYNTNKLISTLVGIFTGFYLSYTCDTITYKMQPNIDKSVYLLIISIFKNELKTYYVIVDSSPERIIVRDNRN